MAWPVAKPVALSQKGKKEGGKAKGDWAEIIFQLWGLLGSLDCNNSTNLLKRPWGEKDLQERVA